MYRELQDLVIRCQNGDAGALAELIDRYRKKEPGADFCLEQLLRPELDEVWARVRTRIHGNVHGQIQSTGVVNAVFKSLLSGIANNQFPDLQNQESIRKLLSVLAERKIMSALRGPLAQGRDARRTEGLFAGERLVAPADEPEEFLEEFFAVVRDVHPLAIQIVEMCWQEMDTNTIAVKLKRSPRWVQLRIREIRTAWETHRQED